MTTNQATSKTKTRIPTNGSRNLLKITAVASMVAALIFRRNLGAEITLLTAQPSPATSADWFMLIQNNMLLGLGWLNIFDAVNYVLLALMFLGIYLALRQAAKKYGTIATSVGLVGVLVYMVSTTSFSMLSLSNQYNIAATDIQKAALLAAGQEVLAKGDPGAIYEGLGGYLSLFLIAAAGLTISITMLQTKIFSRKTAYLGIVATSLDLIYIGSSIFLAAENLPLISAPCMAVAGLLLMVWHLLIGIKLYQLSRTTNIKGGVNA